MGGKGHDFCYTPQGTSNMLELTKSKEALMRPVLVKTKDTKEMMALLGL